MFYNVSNEKTSNSRIIQVNNSTLTTTYVANIIPLDELTVFGLVEPPGLGLSLSDEQPALGEF